MEKMREEFEAWADSIGFTLKPSAFSNGDYAMGYGWQEWSAWQASRAALCVDLPQQLVSREYDDEIMNAGEVIESLENAGVSHK